MSLANRSTAMTACRPLIVSGPMVTAIIAGRKSQTRRLVKLPSWAQPDSEIEFDGDWPHAISRRTGCLSALRCPHGDVRDTLWVREAWARNADQTSDDRIDTSIVYRADGGPRALDNGEELPWRSPIHMPRWASRLTLRITAIRVERLMVISEADAEAEGFRASQSQEPGPEVPLGAHHTIQRMGEYVSAAGAFLTYWDQLHGEGATLANPLVWVIGVERVMP